MYPPTRSSLTKDDRIQHIFRKPQSSAFSTLESPAIYKHRYPGSVSSISLANAHLYKRLEMLQARIDQVAASGPRHQISGNLRKHAKTNSPDLARSMEYYITSKLIDIHDSPNRQDQFFTNAMILVGNNTIELPCIQVDDQSPLNLFPQALALALKLEVYTSEKSMIGDGPHSTIQCCQFTIRVGGIDTKIETAVVPTLSFPILGHTWIEAVNLLVDLDTRCYYVPVPLLDTAALCENSEVQAVRKSQLAVETVGGQQIEHLTLSSEDVLGAENLFDVCPVGDLTLDNKGGSYQELMWSIDKLGESEQDVSFGDDWDACHSEANDTISEGDNVLGGHTENETKSDDVTDEYLYKSEFDSNIHA